jgi:hypothetical protein
MNITFSGRPSLYDFSTAQKGPEETSTNSVEVSGLVGMDSINEGLDAFRRCLWVDSMSKITNVFLVPYSVNHFGHV